ncbi:Protein RETICULATA-related protein [Dioscorea alata]|uniref:Protein RETICULATA-related protein n=1 Tax=Dioscorea alata TaxID=55571 RepID=A0ACB7VSB3_DIOAL|nr:Protein RETICULATA-related protein [Dioscorea alata]
MAAAAAQLRASLLPNPNDPPRSPTRFPRLSSLHLPRSATLHPRLLAGSPSLPPSGPRGPRGTGGGGGGGSSDSNDDDHQHDRKPSRSDPLSLFIEGWRSRVAADPQFPFKVLMEELVGVSANVIGDMATRPNFGLNELDFVFSTLVVGSIVNFVLMYLLAPTAVAAGAVSSSLPPFVFAAGQYSAGARLVALFSKGFAFAAVGFAAGLAGTAISNGLVALRKRMDPGFETNNKPPPTVLNALTWAAHMGVSANVRYQTVNGLEFLMARVLPPAGFKATVVVLRCLNNLLGGMTFVMLARLTGSQKVEEEEKGEKERLILVSREEEDGNGDGRSAAEE